MSLATKDLKQVYRKTFDARNKWQNILLELDVSIGMVRSIGTKYQDKPDDCYREGLAEWLASGKASWRGLVEALSSPTVKCKDIAQQVERDYASMDCTAPDTDIGHAALASSSSEHQQADGPLDEQHQVINQDLVILMKEKLGSGAFGAVFRGIFKSGPCAVKLLHHSAMHLQTDLSAASGQDREKAMGAFKQECDFLESFDHPNVVLHYSTILHPKSGHPLLVTELMDCSLKNFISEKGKKLTIQREVSLSKDIAAGLAYIHRRQIIHRDLCGDNILLKFATEMPTAKISDFGMSRILDPTDVNLTLTAMGQRMGYLPPEAPRIEDELYDHSLDIFSFGVVMLQIMFRLKTVKTVKQRLEYMDKILSSHRLRPAIYNCLHGNQEKRPQADEICSLLETILNTLNFCTKKIESMKWQTRSDMPIKMGGPIQCVVINDQAYVGGGTAIDDRSKCTVMRLNLREDYWTNIQFSTMYFAMVSHMNKLVLIGGLPEGTWKPTDQIAVLDPKSWRKQWMYPYSPMKIARSSSTAISFRSYIIVAGGLDNNRVATCSVELLDTVTAQWFTPRESHYLSILVNPLKYIAPAENDCEWLTAEPLPMARDSLRSTVVIHYSNDDNAYLMGGYDNDDATCAVHRVNLGKLIDQYGSGNGSDNGSPGDSEAEEPILKFWQITEDVPCKYSSPVGLGDYILAFGGCHDDDEPSSAVHMLQSGHWRQIGEMPTPRDNCASAVIPSSGDIIVVGGSHHDIQLSTVEIVSFI